MEKRFGVDISFSRYCGYCGGSQEGGDIGYCRTGFSFILILNQSSLILVCIEFVRPIYHFVL